MERKLASIQIVDNISPIEGADAIEVATVNGWKVVVKKGEFKVGDKCVYCEIDSFLPVVEQFEFLRKSSYRKMGEQEGFRLRTIKLRGQVSQGLLLPAIEGYDVGKDVSEVLGIIKFEPPIPAELSGLMKGSFPIFIPKTDEERIQNLTKVYENFKKNTFYVTEKLDGSSATFYLNNGDFGVCSRNIDLLPSKDNTFWKVAKQLNIEEKLSSLGKNIAIQGELIGERIQGNAYKLKGQTVYFFNAFDIDKQSYLDYFDFTDLMALLNFNTVPVLYTNYNLPKTIDELLASADGNSNLFSTAIREGFVIRSNCRNISFKVISNNFLLKEK